MWSRVVRFTSPCCCNMSARYKYRMTNKRRQRGASSNRKIPRNAIKTSKLNELVMRRYEASKYEQIVAGKTQDLTSRQELESMVAEYYVE